MDRPVPRYLRGLAAAGNSACSTGSNHVDLNVYVSPCGLRIGARLVSTVHQDSGDIALKSRYLHIEANLKKVSELRDAPSLPPVLRALAV